MKKREKIVAMCGRCGFTDNNHESTECDNCGYLHMIKAPAEMARKIRGDISMDQKNRLGGKK